MFIVSIQIQITNLQQWMEYLLTKQLFLNKSYSLCKNIVVSSEKNTN